MVNGFEKTRTQAFEQGESPRNRLRGEVPMNRKVLLGYLLILALVLSGPCAPAAWSAESQAGPVKVAVLPFTMHAPSDLAYLQSGVRDMLTSRLAWQGKVQVLDRSVTDQAVRSPKSDLSPAEAMKIGNTLRADYVLYGSITALGQAISIDARMVPVSGKGDPISLSTQAKMDEVIPQINAFAQQINQKVFARPGEKVQEAAAGEAELLATRNPEFLVAGTMMSSDKISYLNPNFIEVTPDGALRQSGLWASQTLQGGILGMDIGDLDGDGRVEMVAITHDKLTVYRKEYQGLKVVAMHSGLKIDRFVWVCVVDMAREGRGKIFVTNLRKRNTTSTAQTDSAKGSMGFVQDVSSFVLSLEGGKLQMVAQNVPYLLNAVNMGTRGKILIGQEKGGTSDKAFKGDVYEMALRGNSVVPMGSANLPKRCNVFNFAKADINNDKMDEIILVDSSHNLIILNTAGDQIWKNYSVYCATTNTFEGKVEDRRYNMVEMAVVPSPILVTDINKDGIPEIVLTRNTTAADKFLPESMKFYDRGEIVSFSWDQLGMVENWKTRDINGMVTALRIGDFSGDNTQQLVVSQVNAKDLLKVYDSRSTIFSYSLNVAAKPDAEKQAKKQ
ncbi:hypothetical protein Sfum_1746 [Syntrophobacter fumaroxidans MPOB]|uniref:VCBS repeat-containing protein n=2 Tax=Syntrophobacter TaxID=29526 RepID=A0LJ31_SYNFM|nr:hypothetical protein Sfum_1746 [Syntrophobacter fumaroxidans MPOB]